MEDTRYMYYLSRRTKTVAYGILLTVNAIHKKYWEILAVNFLFSGQFPNPKSWIHKKVLLWRALVHIFLNLIFLIKGSEIYQFDKFYLRCTLKLI